MATQAQQTSYDYVAEGLKLVDCDAHWNASPDLWTSRAPAKFKDRVPHVVRRPDGSDGWVIEGDKPFGGIGSVVVDTTGRKYFNMQDVTTFEKSHPAAHNVKERLNLMDEHGIWQQILYGLSSRSFMRFEDLKLRNQCVRSYNDGLAALQPESGDRLFAPAVLPVWDMDETVREMRRAYEDLHMVAIRLDEHFGAMNLPDFNDPYWIPMWDYINSTGLPVCFHVGGSPMDLPKGIWPGYSALSPEDGRGGHTRQSLALNSIFADLANASVMANFLYSDLYDRFPNLKLVSVEGGVGWVPYLLEIADYQLDETIQPHERLGKRRPSEYFRDHWYIMFWFESFGPRHVDEIGVKNVLLETDWPHPTCLYPNSRRHFNEVLGVLDSYARRRIVQDNAVELYHLPPGKD
jgi:predicted TIM-barrel fold metal-dependent hydrolase